MVFIDPSDGLGHNVRVPQGTGRQRMKIRRLLLALVLATLCSLRADAQSAAEPSKGYIEAGACAGCHAAEWNSYRRTGMGRSFSRPDANNRIEDLSKSYYHQASATYYSMVEREGKYFQQQYQVDFDGKRTNFSESLVDFIVGSGNHSRTYLHRTSRNTLIELPLAWYAEKGGYWAMNPGYDRADHQGRRRLIGDDCMFCHDAYPQIPPGDRADPVFTGIPEGIDCQRCHGPGERHVMLARNSAAPRTEVRAAIVNPARLSPERRLEICFQCHLETTSFPLPNSIVRYERRPFSYRASESLADFMLHFDQAEGRNQKERFEIASSAYRLQRSECFRKSSGTLDCTTCHNPHDSPHGGDAAKRYASICRHCHSANFERLVAAGRHTAAADCIGCHMPKRRTDDVVHVVMTDHWIQRNMPARDLLAEIQERPGDANPYRGQVVLYYPQTLPRPEDELYLAVAQVLQSSNLSDGIERLKAAIDKYHPELAEYTLQLADALRKSGKPDQAVPFYEQILSRNPKSIAAFENLALCLMSLGQQGKAAQTLERALDVAPENATLWTLLGTAWAEQNRLPDAIAAFQKAVQLDDTIPEAYNSLGGVLLRRGDFTRSEPALRKAIELEPNYAEAHNNLANLLSSTARFEEARYHFEAALRIQPNNSGTHYDFAIALARANRTADAQRQLEMAIEANPNAAEARELLGTLLASRGDLTRALEQYREAVRIRPEFARANLHLGESLADSGDTAAAIAYLEKAAASAEAPIRAEAQAMLKKIQSKH
jgi:predicted CXXCH cytochrome family protein